MPVKDIEITDFEEFDDVADFYFDDSEMNNQTDWEEGDEDDSYSFRPISEL